MYLTSKTPVKSVKYFQGMLTIFRYKRIPKVPLSLQDVITNEVFGIDSWPCFAKFFAVCNYFFLNW